jgi:cytochrome o ubiquinol oxidase subunit 3
MNEHESVVIEKRITEPMSSKTVLGFWIYLMTDCVLFASLFATYVVLHNNTFGGPPSSQLFNLPFVLIETLLLLTSSFTAGLALLAANQRHQLQFTIFFAITFALGMTFLGMELSEFSNLVAEGNSWQRSGFLTGFFTLVGTHGLHIATGLLWMIVLFVQIQRKNFTAATIRRLTLFSLFWHFLDIIWIFIFTIVYMMGVL